MHQRVLQGSSLPLPGGMGGVLLASCAAILLLIGAVTATEIVLVGNASDSKDQIKFWRNYQGGESPRFCSGSCCWQWAPEHWPYAGDRPYANFSRVDFVSTVNFKQMADALFGFNERPKQFPWYPATLTPQIAPCIQPSSVVLVDTKYLPLFFTEIFPHIQARIILITTDGDESAPKQHLTYLQHDKIIHWFALNCDIRVPHHKLSCLPLGVGQWSLKARDGSERYLLDVMAEVMNAGIGLKMGIYPNKYNPKAQNKTAFAGFNHIGYHNPGQVTRPGLREQLYKQTCQAGGIFKSFTKCFGGSLSRAAIEEHYELTAQYRFVFSPPGFGEDTHRTWESLLLGSIPIVLSSTIEPVYRGLPVVVVKSYEELSFKMLNSIYEDFSRQTFNYGKLYMGYWYSRVGSYRKGYSKAYRILYEPYSATG